MQAIVYLAVLLAAFTAVTIADLRVGAFNIQIFGTSKVKKPDVMPVLVEVIRRYDLLLIQEIRDASGKAIVDLLAAVNENEPADLQFAYTVSERLGRTVSKEQYAYFYRPGKGLSITNVYTHDDGNETLNTDKNAMPVDTFEREPYIAVFKSTETKLSEFALIGIHVAPSDAVKEINSLAKVIDEVRVSNNLENIMVMGDLNADCTYVTNNEKQSLTLRNDAKYKWWIENDADTTVKKTHCAYDRFISAGSGWYTGIVPGSANVYVFDKGFKDKKLAARVSDHYPIEFSLKGSKGSVKISDVYVTLTGGSLKKDLEYSLQWNGVYFYNSKVGYLRGDDETGTVSTAMASIIQDGLNDGDITVVPIKNKYGGVQKCFVYFEFKKENSLFVETLLFEPCKYFKCALTL